MTSILNLSAYKFVAVNDAAHLRESVRSHAAAAGLKGTVLIAEEGINLFLAGSAAAVHAFVAWLREDARFADLHPSFSRSAQVPFDKLHVKLKAEIIRMNERGIRPQRARAPALSALALKRWLDHGRDDAGRPLLLLDTRNAFEVEHGHFAGASHWNLARFGEFPAALQTHRAELQGKTVVSYCTGGIRCEKAALLMRAQGVEHVWQLDGGILQYFEHVGSAHFEGHCFVFDARETLNAPLASAAPVAAAAARV